MMTNTPSPHFAVQRLNEGVMTVFEHQRLEVHDFWQPFDFTWLMAQELAVFTIKRFRGQWQLKVGHYIGVVLLPSGVTLEILPKPIAKTTPAASGTSYPSELHHDVLQTRQWVQNMLAELTNGGQDKGGKLPHAINFAQLSHQLAPLSLVAPLSEWLMGQFLQRIACYQPTTHYQTHIQNQKTLQGRLMIKEQQRRNPLHPHRFVCESSVLSQDMLSNRLIKSALILLHPLLPPSVLAKLLPSWQGVQVLRAYEYQQLETLYTQAKRQLKIQSLSLRQSQAAQALLDLAYWLLKQSNAGTGQGIDTQSPEKLGHLSPRLSILIDMNQAFEQWTSLRLAAMFQQRDPAYQALFQKQRVWLSDADGQAYLSMRPDLLIYRQTVPAAVTNKACVSRTYSHVIDIKWKGLSHPTAINARDAHQLSSYAQSYQAEQAWLVYPVLGHKRRPVALSQNIYPDNDGTNNMTLWLMPFDVLTGTINETSH